MRASDVGVLLLLAALWGGSFLFMRIAAPVLGPVWLIEIRVLLAGLALIPLLLKANAPKESKPEQASLNPIEPHSIPPDQSLGAKIRANLWPLIIVGALNSAFPFVLFSFASISLPAGFISVLNATSPLFGAMVAAVWLKEKLTANRIVGLVLGLAGVMVLMGWQLVAVTPAFVMACGACLAAALMYAIAAPYIKQRLTGTSPLLIATVSQLGAALILVPALPFTVPSAFPSPMVWLSVLALALLSTSLAYPLYFLLIQNIGSTKALTVTFLVPVFAMIWGALVLQEPITRSMVFGCALILLGTAFANGLLKRQSA
ncbi:MAG: DMT family transporter [Phormidesmis sp.]